ncbi:pilus assembly protein [Streptomyces sp. NBC_01571]|uniref:pilus assembly protein n=1 Tax=Streptomyces sp. NBC_01571 TaxID=2975883 RepID=UPI002250D919|nr:pilus assembly protein [Streptomyces sp. NBC_01571]
MKRRLPRRSHDRGSVALSTAIFWPCGLALFGLLIACGRIGLAEGAADAAARDAARTASVAADPATGQADALQAARASLDSSGVHCADIAVTVDAGELAAPVGQAARVTVTVACSAPLSDLLLPGISGSKRLSSTKSSVADIWSSKGAS